MKLLKNTVLCLLLCLSVHAKAQDVYKEQRGGWLQIAEQQKPQLHKSICRPLTACRPVEDKTAYQGWVMQPDNGMESLYTKSFKEIKEITLDFGRHMTGYLTVRLRTTDRVQDGPLRFRFTFAEMPAELATPFDPYTGTLSRAWLQDEVVTVMCVDEPVTIARRLSGRYLKIELLGYSPDFDFAIDDISFNAVSSADKPAKALPEGVSKEIADIYEVGVKTLAECMQTVYEDGPKRDQRLWIGDLYLEAQANTYSFERHELTRRCLYLLAALAAPDGKLYANVFERPTPHPQLGSYCLSYNLLFNAALLDYVKTTGDVQTAEDLWCVAHNQMEDALSYVDSRGIFDRNSKGGFVWLFFDWRNGYEESTSMQGLTVFALDRTLELARLIGREKEVAHWSAKAQQMRKAARKYLYDKPLGLYVSGPERQVSYLSQVWAILSGIATPKEGCALLDRLAAMPDAIRPGSPYGNHYLVEAMIRCGRTEQAYDFVVDYWGGMVKKGADTFWEVYDPNDDYLSPYSFHPMNSYCHAWSCTPVYFIHRYPEVFQR